MVLVCLVWFVFMMIAKDPYGTGFAGIALGIWISTLIREYVRKY